MDLNTLVKSSAAEMADFAKRNAMPMAILADLRRARDSCKSREAQGMIEGLILPLQKELQKETVAFDAKMNAIWKKAKGEKLPDDVKKKLDEAMKSGAKQIKSKSGQDVTHDSNPDHKSWIELF